MNLYAYDLKTKQTRALTRFAEYDVKFPSLGPSAIVFENGGFIYRFDLASEKTEKVPIVIADDRLSARSRIANVASRVTNYEISPDGKRALFGARGEIFTVPAKYGNIRNLTTTSDVHERNSKWSPDGKWIAYISDVSGEDAVYLRPQDGTGTPTQLTFNADTYKYGFFWSPDGKKIAWTDKLFRLQFLDVETKKVALIDKAKTGEMGAFSWSPDSRWIAFTKPEVEGMAKIYLYALDGAKIIEATDGWYQSYEPVFSGDGKYCSSFPTGFQSRFEQRRAQLLLREHVPDLLSALAADTPSPFAPRATKSKSKRMPNRPRQTTRPSRRAEESRARKTAGVTVKVDAEGLKDRLIQLPVDPSNYGGLASVGDKIFYQKFSGGALSLKCYSLSIRKRPTWDRSTATKSRPTARRCWSPGPVLRHHRPALRAGPTRGKARPLGDGHALDLKQEWEHIFLESWRQMKYFFYAANMHGQDWDALKAKYLPLAKAADCRAD
jgi:tricorn protease